MRAETAARHAAGEFGVYGAGGERRAVRHVDLLLEFGKAAALVAFDRVAQHGHAGFGAALAEYADRVRRVLSHVSHELQDGVRQRLAVPLHVQLQRHAEHLLIFEQTLVQRFLMPLDKLGHGPLHKNKYFVKTIKYFEGFYVRNTNLHC